MTTIGAGPSPNVRATVPSAASQDGQVAPVDARSANVLSEDRRAASLNVSSSTGSGVPRAWW